MPCRYQLEREFRVRLRAAEDTVRAECLDAVEADAKEAVVQRDQLTQFLYRTGDDVNVVNRQLCVQAEHVQSTALQLEVAEQLGLEHARVAVGLRRQVAQLQHRNQQLQQRVDQHTVRGSSSNEHLERAARAEDTHPACLA